MIGIDTIGKKAASIASILILMGLILGFLDVRHAKASDVAGIYDRMDRQAIDDTEDKIDDVEDEIAELDRKPVLDEVEMYRLSKMMKKKSKLVRRLESYQ